jgi:hypothetical protein
MTTVANDRTQLRCGRRPPRRRAHDGGDWSRGFGDTSKPRPQIVFVKDEGIYLMSNGKPRDIVDSERSFVVYAEGYDPEPESAAPQLYPRRWGCGLSHRQPCSPGSKARD